MSHPFAVVAWNRHDVADVVGPFDDVQEARRTADRMRNEGVFDDCVITTVEMRPTR